jgi:hypothetical protein
VRLTRDDDDAHDARDTLVTAPVRAIEDVIAIVRARFDVVVDSRMYKFPNDRKRTGRVRPSVDSFDPHSTARSIAVGAFGDRVRGRPVDRVASRRRLARRASTRISFTNRI